LSAVLLTAADAGAQTLPLPASKDGAKDVIAGPSATPATPAPGMDVLAASLAKANEAAFAKKFDQELSAAAKKNLFSGVVAIAKGGRIFFEKAYGPADRDHDVANRTDTRFNMASANKMFTAVAIAQLVERGKLSFDDTLDKYLDASWLSPDLLGKIRIEHLLSHTSGLGSYFSPEFDRASRTLYRSVDDFKPLVVRSTLAFEPGSAWAYSNTGFLLLGAVIEKVSGGTYFDFVRDNILKPAGMNSTDALDLELVNKNIAIGYAKMPNAAPLQPPPAPAPGAPPPRLPPPPRLMDVAASVNERDAQIEAAGGYYWRNNIFAHVVKGGPAGGYYTTGADLVRFFDALRTGKLVKPATLKLLTTPKPSSTGFGYGFQLEDGSYGHTGGFLGVSVAAFALDHDYSFIVLSNVSPQGFTPLAKALNALR
jgi:CubicO group peptidase (beta-lactamase class C family)